MKHGGACELLSLSKMSEVNRLGANGLVTVTSCVAGVAWEGLCTGVMCSLASLGASGAQAQRILQSKKNNIHFKRPGCICPSDVSATCP